MGLKQTRWGERPINEKRALERLELYLHRTKVALEDGERPTALASLAEVGEIARRLYCLISKSSDS